MKKYFIVLILIILIDDACAQNNHEVFVTANTNLYVPFNADKGLFPVLGYDKEATPKLLIGGFGTGVTMFKTIREKTRLKVQSNISRHTYWNEPMTFRTVDNQNLGTFSSRSSDYTLGVSGIALLGSNKFSFGAGLGLQVMLASVTRNPVGNFAGQDNEQQLVLNRYYKMLMPVLPLEISVQLDKMFYSIRYEHALLNKYKNGLANRERENYGLIFTEIGVRIK